jgi:hypothetical protein
MLTFGVLLHHDNVCQHKTACTQALLEHFNWELITLLTTLTLLYHLFTFLKNWLQSQRFNNNEKLMEGVNTWLSSQAADFFDTGIQETCSPIW